MVPDWVLRDRKTEYWVTRPLDVQISTCYLVGGVNNGTAEHNKPTNY